MMTMSTPTLPRISDYAAFHARRTPDAEAMSVNGQSYSYADTMLHIDRLARALIAAGVRKGDRVATLQNPHPDYFIAFLASASIGAIWVGLNPKYRGEELRRIVADCEPKILLSRSQIEGRDYSDELQMLRKTCPALEHIVTFSGDPPCAGAQTMERFLAAGESASEQLLMSMREGCGGRDPCLIVYTSGSTGRPKGALLHHEGIVSFSLAQNRLWPVDPLRIVNYFPINHVGCVIDVSVPCLVAGGCIAFMEHFTPLECLELMVRERATIWGSVPSVFQLQLDLPEFAQFDLSALQLILWEGAAMPVHLLQRLLQIGPKLATNYGMTETTSAITALQPTRDLDLLANTVGSAFPGVEIRLVDAAGNDVADETPGEVWAQSRYNLLGYWGATAPDALSADGFFKTGDLAVRRRDGRFRIVGRLKEMFKSGGYNVYPQEIEAVLEAHPAVAMVAVVSAPDPLWQEIGVAFVAATSQVTEADLRSWCQQRLANYKVPKKFVVCAQLPLLPIGKIDRVALKRSVS
jgi:acyl-CoA synthetase (AMP-forming)/AMP-acid ligase II